MRQLSPGKVRLFKIVNRKGYACICADNLTEGKTPLQAYERMAKCCKRAGVALKEIDGAAALRLVSNS